jgi:hypothetical protein
VSLLPLLPLSRVPENEPLHELLNLFQQTGVHPASMRKLLWSRSEASREHESMLRGHTDSGGVGALGAQGCTQHW